MPASTNVASGPAALATRAASGADHVAPPELDTVADVRTHQLLLAVLGAAQDGRGRRGVARELVDGALHRGSYRTSREELSICRSDPASAVPLALAACATIVHPPAWAWFSSGSVANYALSPAGWRAIRACAGA